jgi:MOSC domain-containing protein YiiM
MNACPLPYVASVQVSLPKQFGDPNSSDAMEKVWVTGFYKLPVAEPVAVTRLGLTGDGQADLKNHGGVDKAVLGYSAAHYPFWIEQLKMLKQMSVGSNRGATSADSSGPSLQSSVGGAFGENLTVIGVTESSICIGDRWQIGTVLFEVSQPRQPCWKLGRRWQEKMLPKWVTQTGFSGWYYRVVQEGVLQASQTMKLLERPYPQWTIARANDILYGREIDTMAMMELSLLPELSHAWKESLG